MDRGRLMLLHETAAYIGAIGAFVSLAILIVVLLALVEIRNGHKRLAQLYATLVDLVRRDLEENAAINRILARRNGPPSE